MLAEQLRDGVAARVILIGIEAASAGQTEAAAKRSQQVAATLRADPRFAFVANGDPAMFVVERDRLFDARYLLSAQVTPQRFSVEGLRAAADELEALLRSSAAPLIKPTAARDLTGELLSVAAALKPGVRRQVHTECGSTRPAASRYCSRQHVRQDSTSMLNPKRSQPYVLHSALRSPRRQRGRHRNCNCI